MVSLIIELRTEYENPLGFTLLTQQLLISARESMAHDPYLLWDSWLACHLPSKLSHLHSGQRMQE